MSTSSLNVEVGTTDIIVSRPGEPSQKIVYRRELGARMLVAEDVLYSRVLPVPPEFLASAWRAAFDKAKSIGWL